MTSAKMSALIDVENTLTNIKHEYERLIEVTSKFRKTEQHFSSELQAILNQQETFFKSFDDYYFNASEPAENDVDNEDHWINFYYMELKSEYRERAEVRQQEKEVLAEKVKRVLK